eukprot:1637034-Rhodomonas_salina.1
MMKSVTAPTVKAAMSSTTMYTGILPSRAHATHEHGKSARCYVMSRTDGAACGRSAWLCERCSGRA